VCHVTVLQNSTKVIEMNRKKKEINTKLQKLGKTLGLEDSDIIRAKINIRSALCVAVLSAAVLAIGMVTVIQLDGIGLYYTGVSIRDFGLFSRFF